MTVLLYTVVRNETQKKTFHYTRNMHLWLICFLGEFSNSVKRESGEEAHSLNFAWWLQASKDSAKTFLSMVDE